MIGQVENITRFGLFVKISTDKLDESTEKLADKAVSKNRGLLRCLKKGYKNWYVVMVIELKGYCFQIPFLISGRFVTETTKLCYKQLSFNLKFQCPSFVFP